MQYPYLVDFRILAFTNHEKQGELMVRSLYQIEAFIMIKARFNMQIFILITGKNMVCLFSKNTISISHWFSCFGFYKP